MLTIKNLLHQYRTGRTTVRRRLTELYRAASEAPAGIWISLISEAQLEQYLARLERLSPDSLPLYGIPFAVKDNIDLAGIPTTAACPAYAYTPERSARVVELLVEAGAVPLGKTNMDQFATGLVGVRSPYGVTPNRLAPGYVAGGSSSGSAAALAHGLCSFSLGTDTAGSGRIPAAFNELVGVKPSRGLLSTRGVVPACRTLDCVSIFALTLEDAEILLEATAEFDPEDAYSRAAPKVNPLPCRWKFGVPRDEELEFFGNCAYRDAFSRAVRRMEAAGGRRVTIDFAPFLAAARLLYEGPWVFERYAAVGGFIESHPGAALPVIETIITPGQTPHPSEVFRGMYRLQECKAKADAELAKVDLLLTPTAGTIYRIGEVEADPIRLNSNLGHYTNYMNLLDYAALAIPAARAGKLPFGVTLVGRAFDDGRLLEAARRFRLAEPYTVAVCGAHLAGMPLHSELEELGACFLGSAETAPRYRVAFLSGKIVRILQFCFSRAAANTNADN